MGWELESVTQPVASKTFNCQASDWINNADLGQADYSPEDWATIKKAQFEKWEIRPGTQYTKTEGKWEGEFSVFRARLDLDAICQKYGIYQEI